TMVARGLESASRVACVSSATRRDLLRLTSVGQEDTLVIFNPLEPTFSPLDPSEGREIVRGLFGRKDPNKYIIHVGSDVWYKNRIGLIEIYRLLVQEMRNPPDLVLAGKALSQELRDVIAGSGLESRVHQFKNPTDLELRALYSEAELFVFPS